MSGVLIFKGIKSGFRPGDLVISMGENGQPSLAVTLSTSYNMIPIWLKIAHDHRKLAKIAKQNIEASWNDAPEKQGDMLFAELMPSIQVVVACATAIDALYALLKPLSGISKADSDAWKKNRTSRSAQIFEVISRVYKLPQDLGKEVKQMLKEIADTRDKAVHPSHELTPAMRRPDIPVGLDWRFCEYRYESCASCYTNTMNLFLHVYNLGSKTPEVNQEMEFIVSALIELGLISKPTSTG